MDQKTWLLKHLPSMQGKTAAITGATGGLGKELCRGILCLGGNLLLLNRDPRKTADLIKALKEEYPQAQIDFLPLDLTDMDSVNRVCRELKKQVPQVLLHNAGIYDVPRYSLPTGLNNVFQVNFAAPYYMTKQLLPELRAHRSRVAVVGSIACSYAKSDPEDPDFSSRSACHLCYGNSKRYLMYAFSQLFQGETAAEFSIGHPGITLTNISNHYPAWLYPLIRPFLKLFFMKPRTACRSILYAVTYSTGPGCWAGPRFFHIWGAPSVQPLTCCSREEQLQIFDTAEAIFQKLS